ncbi:MAG TPA: S8/S53 family peptidase [Thermoanaerobaculia bacterium]
MSRKYLFWIVACLAIATSACATLRPPPPRLDAAKACADWRWIGISQPGAQCPEIKGWTVRPLFAQVAPAHQISEDFCPQEKNYCDAIKHEKVPSLEVIRELNRFCVYEFAHKWGHPKVPPKSPELTRLDPDCAALSTSAGEDLDEGRLGTLSRRFLAQAGQETFKINNANGVRLSFLDTEETRGEMPKPDQPRLSLHGFTLANVGRNLVCQGEKCAARITTRLALPFQKFDAKSRKLTKGKPGLGGYIGMQGDLAAAITDEVTAWQSARRPGSLEEHLVLNLSLAWDGELFGGLDEGQICEMRAGTQAIFRALQYAAGFDALVLAAAGNQKGEPCNNFGPLLPAAWEIGGPPEEDCDAARKAPLVYAVAGVGGGSSPVVNARDGGTPRRVAVGEGGVVASLDPARHTAMLTGSSVATSVVSSIAAVVWSSFPHLTSQQVMEILDGSGKELLKDADFWFGANDSPPTPRPKVHRVSLCKALEAACGSPLNSAVIARVRCPLTAACADPESADSPEDPASKFVPDSCQPWLHPQPEIPPCLSCGPPASR